ncbi:transcriptional regulator, AraC family [Luminiphilus syltensis NOR5-1B]|uniref:Transcriptional regulator, AraC family n=1 Tax=Luminiphilus syltensis NOR5-1B TaxID=565045 RepID=B8KTU4_9GAMM|nr:helix-turn-helix domain-containing protein [Luminiphilus syltensis]EED34764.1 transcriptional regulator, AraC family [Luminiphilus syltensis NOR5-1B]
MSTPHDFVKSYLSAWNHRDPEGVASHFCRDGHYVDIPNQQDLTGDALVAHLVEYFKKDNYRYELQGDVLINDGTLAFQYRVTSPDDDEAQPSWGGAEFIELGDRGARSISDYYRLPSEPGKRSTKTDRYAKSGLSESAMEQVLTTLDQLMGKNKLFLDPELTLPRLAERVGCSVNHLSQAINAGHEMSFFDYINRYRVDEAQQILVQPDNRFPAILDVALSVGFNSTSTFYTAFKKATGQTPASFRRSHN